MKPVDLSWLRVEVRRLRRKGLSVRRIARHLQVARTTVRTLLGQHGAPVKPTATRGSFLDPYEKANRTFLADTPEIRVPREPT